MEVGARTGGVPTLERLARRLTRPRLVTVTESSLSMVPVPEAIAAVGEPLEDFAVEHLEPADQATLITAVERAQRLGMARAMVRFRGDDLTSLLNVVDLRADLGVLAYVFSADAMVDEDDDATVDPVASGEASPLDDDADDGLHVVISPGGRLLEIHGSIPGLLDDADAAIGEPLLGFLHPDDVHRALTTAADVLADHRRTRRLEVRFRTGTDGWRFIEGHLHAHQHGDDVEIICLLNDVDARERAREALEERARVLHTLTDSLPIGVVASDDVGTIRFANRAFTEITGIDPKTQDWLDFVHPDDVSELAAAMARLGFYGDGIVSDIRVRRPDNGRHRLMNLSIKANRAPDGKLVDIVGSLEDVTDSRGESLRLQQEATHDALTGLANRVGVEQDLGARLDRFHSAREPIAVLFIDLDHFAQVNDTFGHAEGDEVLIQIGQRIRAETREGDLVGRFGGDEFVVIAEPTGGPDGALGLAHRIANVISSPVTVVGTTVRPQACIGISLSSGPGTRVDELVREADAAAREAKGRGPGVVWLADQQIRRRVVQTQGLEQALARAMDEDTCRFAYQPIADLVTGEIYGAEGVIQWEDEAFGSTPPTELLPIAERTGLIHQLGTWATHQAAIDCRQLRDSLDVHPEFRLGVHLTASQLSAPGFVERFLGELEDVGTDPAEMVVEVSRAQLLSHRGDAEDSLLALADAGTLLALDGLGGDTASFDDLVRLPVRYAKIAPGLVRGLVDCEKRQAVVRHLALMCQDLGITPFAGGVEDEAVRAACVAAGITEGQDSRLGRALAVDDLVTRLEGARSTAPAT